MTWIESTDELEVRDMPGGEPVWNVTLQTSSDEAAVYKIRLPWMNCHVAIPDEWCTEELAIDIAHHAREIGCNLVFVSEPARRDMLIDPQWYGESGEPFGYKQWYCKVSFIVDSEKVSEDDVSGTSEQVQARQHGVS